MTYEALNKRHHSSSRALEKHLQQDDSTRDETSLQTRVSSRRRVRRISALCSPERRKSYHQTCDLLYVCFSDLRAILKINYRTSFFLGVMNRRLSFRLDCCSTTAQSNYKHKQKLLKKNQYKIALLFISFFIFEMCIWREKVTLGDEATL